MIFQITQRIKRPVVIVADRRSNVETVTYQQRTDTMHLVMPHTAREVMALQMLDHQVDKFAPAIGNGVLITEAAHQKLNA